VEALVRGGRDVPHECSRLRAAAAGASEHTAHVILSTAHKAKGLEWDRVLLHDDFLQVGWLVLRDALEVLEAVPIPKSTSSSPGGCSGQRIANTSC
jgi:hypothetical protein